MAVTKPAAMEDFFQCLIVEDETYSANLIVDYLKEFDNFNTPHIAQSIGEAVREIQNQCFDLIFCDIHLPDGNAIDLIKSNAIRTPMILVTGDKHQSLLAYELDVVDYLVKPVSQARFNKALEKLMEVIEGRKQLQKKLKSTELITGNRNLEEILILRYHLSPTESALCRSVVQGKTVDEILALHSITINTYKSHMKHIFSKTIDRGSIHASKGQGKLQRLTLLLMQLKDEAE